MVHHGNEGAATLREFEIITAFRHALDRTYTRMSRVARTHWENAFTDAQDPSDAIVSIRIAAATEPQRACGFLTTRAEPCARNLGIQPRFAD